MRMCHSSDHHGLHFRKICVYGKVPTKRWKEAGDDVPRLAIPWIVADSVLQIMTIGPVSLCDGLWLYIAEGSCYV